MRLIDADRLKRSFEANTPIAFQDCVPGIHSVIDLEPTVEAEPIRHGNWIKNYETDDGRSLRCSKCRMVFWVGYGRDGNYCPNCGAKMDEVKEE